MTREKDSEIMERKVLWSFNLRGSVAEISENFVLANRKRGGHAYSPESRHRIGYSQLSDISATVGRREKWKRTF